MSLMANLLDKAAGVMEKRWIVGFSAEPSLMPVSMRAEGRQYADRPYKNTARPCRTYREARRISRRRNKSRSGRAQPGTWEVFGPLGKGD
jgi:hypothetical protein